MNKSQFKFAQLQAWHREQLANQKLRREQSRALLLQTKHEAYAEQKRLEAELRA